MKRILIATLLLVASPLMAEPKTFDLPYADNENPRQRVTIQFPEGHDPGEKLPIVVFVHGGGWRSGSREGMMRWAAPMYLQTGKYAVAGIGYRLTDEASWPAQLDDCKAGVRLIRAKADELGIDSDRIAVMGASAGGHLVALLGVTGNEPASAGKLGSHLDQSSAVACVVDCFGPTDLLKRSAVADNADKYATSSVGKLLGPQDDGWDTRARQASPVFHVDANDPPILIVHGVDDPIVPYQQSVEFDKALKDAGVPCVFLSADSGGHGAFKASVFETIKKYVDKQLLGEGESLQDQTLKDAGRPKK